MSAAKLSLLPVSSEVSLNFVPADPVVWVRALEGEGPGTPRRGDKTLHAISQCAYYCPNADIAAKALAALKDSDDRLRERAEELMLWDWQNTYWEVDRDNQDGGGTIHLGVAWYDAAFYDDRREAWFGAMHKHIYSKIGIPIDGISVTHLLVDRAAA